VIFTEIVVEPITLETVTAWWDIARAGIGIVAFTCGALLALNL
jgi:hypothetical protein